MKMRYRLRDKLLNPKERDYLEGKAAKFEKYLQGKKDSETFMDIKVDRDRKGFWLTEMIIKKDGTTFLSQKTDKNFLTSVDLAEGALMQQVRAK